MALKQSLSQKLEQRLSPQQIQLMKLLQVPTMELDARIKQEIEENPALEEGKEEVDDDFSNDQDTDYDDGGDDNDFDINDYISDDEPAYKTKTSNKGKDDDETSIPLSSGSSFQERLREQLHLRNLSDQDYLIAETLIGNLDDAGYLERDLEAIVDDLAFSQNIMTSEEELEKLLEVIQDLDPAGVGARDLQECLLLQIKRRQNGDITRYTAKKILEDHFEEFTKKHYTKILKKLEISDDDLKAAIDEIIRLNPKPGGSLKSSSKSLEQVTPDFIITEQDGKLELSLHGRNAPDLKVSRSYEKMLRNILKAQNLRSRTKKPLPL